MSDVSGFDARLREAREALGYSLSELARRSGVSKGYLWQLENGDSTSPGIGTVAALAEVLGMSLDALVLGQEGDVSAGEAYRTGYRHGEDAAFSRMKSALDRLRLRKDGGDDAVDA